MIKMVWMECAIWKLDNLCLQFNSVFCVRWMSQVQGVVFPKRRKGVCHQFYSEIYGLREIMAVADFSGTESKKCSTKSDVEISHDVNKC